MDLLLAAKQFATLHHVIRKGQLYGVLPYTHHLQAVEMTLRELGESRDFMLAAAWLHDVVEDTDVKIRDIEENFGEEVAHVVFAVTAEGGALRSVKNAVTYPKIRAAGPDAIRLKLADRLANVRNGGSMGKKYAKEYPDFRHALRDPNDRFNYKAWIFLDDEIDHILGETKWCTDPYV